MKIRLLCVGKTNFTFLKEGEQEYMNRLMHYCNFERLDLADVKTGASLSHNELKNKEGQLILSKVNPTDFLILLDERGNRLVQWIFLPLLKKKRCKEKRGLFL